MSYYKIIDGVRYDRSLLDAADFYTKGRGEWQISLEEIQHIYGIATDSKVITEIEWRTIRYVSYQYQLTDPARKWLEAKLKGPEALEDLETIMEQIVRKEFGFKRLKWKIDYEEANRQHHNILNVVDFPQAVRSALRGFLENGYTPLSLQEIISKNLEGEFTSEKLKLEVKHAIDKDGVLFLIPALEADQKKLEFDLPDFINTDEVWNFGLYLPELIPLLFITRVPRTYQAPAFNSGYISRLIELDELISTIIRNLAGFPNLQWNISTDEVNRQLKKLPNQNFGKALFAALRIGIYNGESSFSFRDFIQRDIWPDPAKDLNGYIHGYVDSGKIILLSDEGIENFNVPEFLKPDLETQWAFGLEMPNKTNIRFIITANRSGDYDFSWSDGFEPEGITIEDQIQQVRTVEFNLPSLEVIVPTEEYEAQRLNFGPDYRSFSSLLRQALNTIFNDYINPYSVFNTVARVKNLNPTQFASVQEFRQAIQNLIYDYLKTGSLEFLPIELPDNNPVDGESIEKYWQFFGYIPDFQPVGFWVIIPRYPDDSELPYSYGFDV